MDDLKRKRGSLDSSSSPLSDWPIHLSDTTSESEKRIRLTPPTPASEHSASCIASEEQQPSNVAHASPSRFSTWTKAQWMALTAQITHIEHPKPSPSGEPEVHAKGRQAICETMDSYRAFGSAAYTSGGFIRAVMFDEAAMKRDLIGRDFIIAGAGGGKKKDKETGKMALASDQNNGNLIKCLRNSKEYLDPMVVIVGRSNPKMPSQSPYLYSVLDAFKPTEDIWYERVNGKLSMRYRLERFGNEKSWWMPDNGTDPVSCGDLPKPIVKTCASCGITSKQVYINPGWMCLVDPTCKNFWKLPSGQEPNENEMVYDARFLKQKRPWKNENEKFRFIPEHPELSGHNIPGEDCSRASWNGIVCPQCHGCIMRISWRGWFCSSQGCSFEKLVRHTLIPAKSLKDPFCNIGYGYPRAGNSHRPEIKLTVSFGHNYRFNRYKLEGCVGDLTHMQANKAVIEEPGGVDDMFEELQSREIALKRRPMENCAMKGQSYTRHYAANYGMPYAYVADHDDSYSFDGAPDAVNHGRTILNEASKFVSLKEHIEFNEVLMLMYYEGQKIGYHSDGERELGPTIATLSIGASATMTLRMKESHWHGMSKSGVYEDKPPMLGCKMYRERLALVPQLAALKAQLMPGAYKQRLKEIAKELGLNLKGKPPVVATLKLRHGDIVMMHGYDVQEYYEHSVEPDPSIDKLRYALTCRYIDPELVKPEARPQYEVKPDTGFYDGFMTEGVRDQLETAQDEPTEDEHFEPLEVGEETEAGDTISSGIDMTTLEMEQTPTQHFHFTNYQSRPPQSQDLQDGPHHTENVLMHSPRYQMTPGNDSLIHQHPRAITLKLPPDVLHRLHTPAPTQIPMASPTIHAPMPIFPPFASNLSLQQPQQPVIQYPTSSSPLSAFSPPTSRSGRPLIMSSRLRETQEHGSTFGPTQQPYTNTANIGGTQLAFGNPVSYTQGIESGTQIHNWGMMGTNVSNGTDGMGQCLIGKVQMNPVVADMNPTRATMPSPGFQHTPATPKKNKRALRRATEATPESPSPRRSARLANRDGQSKL